MKIFKSDTDILKRSSPARLSKRFACRVIDLALVALLAAFVFVGAFQITQGTEAYIDAEQTLEYEIDYYKSITADTHIVEYVEGARVTTDVIVLKNLYRAICLSYEIFGNDQQPDFTFDADHDVMINGVHSAENDNVAYFYTRYLKNDNSLGIEADADVFEIYKRAFGNDASFIFSFNKELSEIPVLNTQVAYYLFHYFFIDESDSIGQTGATYYEAYYNAYSRMLDEAEALILRSEPYYSTHYSQYMEAFSAQARYTNIALVVSIFIACLAVLLVPRYLFKNDRTIGYRLLGLGAIGTDREENGWYTPIIKALFDCVGAIPIAFILYLFPPFNGGYEAMFVPITPSSRFSFAWIILIILAVFGVINAFGLFTSKKQSLVNMLLSEVVVDLHYIDEGDRDE